MDGVKQINDFFDVIDGFNAQAISHIKRGDIQGAIDLYKLKCKFITWAYEADVICIERASTMLTDTNSIIKSLRGEDDKKEDAKIEDDYTIIKIPLNSNNLDVLRRVFDCRVTEVNDALSTAHTDLDEDTIFNIYWLKSKYKGGANNETNKSPFLVLIILNATTIASLNPMLPFALIVSPFTGYMLILEISIIVYSSLSFSSLSDVSRETFLLSSVNSSSSVD